MLAQTVDLDIAQHDHAAGFLGEACPVDHRLDILMVARGEKLQCRCHSPRGVEQPFARWVFANLDQQLAHQFLDLLKIHGHGWTPFASARCSPAMAPFHLWAALPRSPGWTGPAPADTVPAPVPITARPRMGAPGCRGRGA